MAHETAVLGGGCFWCTEAIFQRVRGIKSVVPGYAGGQVENPTYRAVCNGDTGHAEVVQIDFDPEVISFKDILEIFWHIHDPTSVNRQGNDIGTQYRSIILYSSDKQRIVAEKSLKEMDESGNFNRSIVTEIVQLVQFYEAEEYHLDYFANNKNQPYCRAIISPKIKHFMADNSEKLKKEYLK